MYKTIERQDQNQLMKETEFDKDLKKAITAEKRKEQKEYLRSLETSLSEPQKTSQRSNWLIAASIAIVIGLASTFFLWNQDSSVDELYDTYFAPYGNVVAPIVRDQSTVSKKAHAFAQYEQGEYLKAIEAFDALVDQDSLDIITSNFYKANAFLQLDEWDTAKKLLLQVVDQNKEWKEESLWYLALASLKLKQIDSAKSYLLRLQKLDENAFKKKEINDLLDSLD